MNDIDPGILNLEDISVRSAIASWLSAFEDALSNTDKAALASLFEDDSHWRDLVAFTWHLSPCAGAADIAIGLTNAQGSIKASGFTIDPNRTPPRRAKRLGRDVIEAFFVFETELGRGNGVVRLLDDTNARAWNFLTTLEELKGHEEHLGPRRPSGEAYSRNFGGETWLDQRTRSQA